MRWKFRRSGAGITDDGYQYADADEDGTLYRQILWISGKEPPGKPGEMTGMIIYSDDRILGQITSNSARGIFGKCNAKAMEMADKEPLPIGLKQEIVEGEAQILCTVENVPKYYDVRITAVHLDHDNINRGIELQVTDEELLELTGGIVQGMSGFPH